jgi:predicted secreted protein
MGDTPMLAALTALAMSMLLLQPTLPTAGTPAGAGNLISPAGAQLTVPCDAFSSTERGAGSTGVVRDLAVVAGGTFTVTMCSNPSTGFSWEQPAFDHTFLASLDHVATAPGEQLVGAAGSETWTFRVLGDGKGTLAFSYSQPWNGGTKAAWTLTINVSTAAANATRTVSCDERGVVTGVVRPDPLTVSVGETLAITLCANPSTGFSWNRVDFGNSGFQLVSHETAASATGLIGASGTETWTFKALRAGDADLVFWYLRAWEAGPQIGVVWLAVHVTP